jgi:long-chain acyl-CoA synthetase
MNITEPIFRQAKLRPEALALALAQDKLRLTYAQLARAIVATAAQFQARGIRKDDRVAVTMPSTPLHLIVVLALAYIGAVSVPRNRSMPMADQHALLDLLDVKHLVCSAGLPAVFAANFKQPLIEVDANWFNQAPVANVAMAPGGARPFRLALSSGTTGLPKVMCWTHEQTHLFNGLMSSLIPTGASTRLGIFIGIATHIGLQHCLRNLLRGAAVIFPPNEGPKAFVAAINEHQIDVAITAPATAARMIDALLEEPDAQVPDAPLCPSLKYLGFGGSALTLKQREAIRVWITPNLYSHYGSTEGGLMALAPPDMLLGDVTASGQCVPWVKAHAVDANGQKLAPGKVGRLAFKSSVFCTAYENNPKATANTFVNGWYVSGDNGSVDLAGVIRLTGRDDDLINLGGTKITPGDVESVLLNLPGIDDAAVCAVKLTEGGRELLVAAVTSRAPIDEADLLRLCRAELTPQMTPSHVLKVDRLPRNEGGKLDRKALAAKVLVERKAKAP